METYGDLKKAINAIKLKQKGTKVGGLAIDVALDMIPGIGAAKTTFDFVKAAFGKPDTKKTKTWLDKLDVDDKMSSIVDDTVENGFLQTIASAIESESDDTPLEDDFNMNSKMVNYLKNKYDGRTITGITEYKMKYRLPKNIKEIDTKLPSSITTISKDLSDQSSNFKQINNKDRMVQLFDVIVSKIKENNPDFVESPLFKQAIIAIYNKYK
jgi:hypothetical protein